MVKSGWNCALRVGCVGKVGPDEGLSELVMVHVEDVGGSMDESRKGDDVGKLR